MSEEVISVLLIFHNACKGWHAISECLEGSFCDLCVRIFESKYDGSENGFLQGFLEVEIEVFELLADESYGQN